MCFFIRNLSNAPEKYILKNKSEFSKLWEREEGGRQGVKGWRER
jgi:hypothetical protein